jgi:hypothetical protein
MKAIKIFALLIVPALLFGVLALSDTSRAQDPPPAPPDRPAVRPNPQYQPPDQFPMLTNEVFKEEVTRHREALNKINEDTKAMRDELLKKAQELWQKHFPPPTPPAEGEEPVMPDWRKMMEQFQTQLQAYQEELKRIVEVYSAEHEKELKAVSGKIFDEYVLHYTNVLKIAKENKDKIVDAHWKTILTSAIADRIRNAGGGNRRMGGGGNRPGGQTTPPAPPDNPTPFEK